MPLYSPTDYERRLKGPNPTGRCEEEPYRSEFRRDYGRLIHCAAFRRLKGKTQLFPEFESDFFRNRLTHSLEVAQIAKSIAAKLSHEYDFFRRNGEINSDVVEIAGLAHDLGHPPFGHNGEQALDDRMVTYGGFEGNAQTFRILSILEKKATDGSTSEYSYGVLDGGDDRRFGLDLCARTLAAVLKYDNPIPTVRTESYDRPQKGYYSSESEIVKKVKTAVLGTANADRKMKTLECSIMDLADDIAYSTYDLEDAFKGKLFLPMELIAARKPMLERVATAINRKRVQGLDEITADDVRSVVLLVFERQLSDPERDRKLAGKEPPVESDFLGYLTRRQQALTDLGEVGYIRTRFTADLVGEFIRSVEFEPDTDVPALSKAFLGSAALKKLEILKTFTYECLIESPRLKIAAYRGKEIVKTLFDELSGPDGHELLPDDFRSWFENFDGDDARQKRVVCDFIAGMTDEYAVEFYGRLRSEDPATIFRPI